MPFVFNKTKLAVAWLAVASAGLMVGVGSYVKARQNELKALSDDARRCALVFDSADLAPLSGVRGDETLPAYAQVKDRLMKLNAAHPTIDYIYLYRYFPETGDIVCLADSEPPESPNISHPGDLFSGMMKNSDVLLTVRTGQVSINESQSDVFGSWVTAYARVGEADTNNIIRIDEPIKLWRSILVTAAFTKAFYVWLLLGLPLAAYILARRYSIQMLSIHKLNVAIEQSETAMMVVDVNGNIEYVNKGLCTMSRFTRNELIGKQWVESSRATPQEKVAKIQVLSREGKTWTENLELERNGGERFPASVTSTPVRDSSGVIVAFIVVIADVTELQRQAAELRIAKERAETADGAKGVFLATMSHEVRTPLNGIIGFTDLLLGTEMTAEQREYVHTIHSSGEALMQLAENILDYSRLESGRMHLTLEPCDLRELIEEVLDMVAPRAAGKKLQLLHEVDLAVPEQMLIDAGRMRQVLVNLVGNAIKFTPSGEVEVRVRMAATGRSESAPPFDATAVVKSRNVVGDEDIAAETVAIPQDDLVRLEFAVRDTGIGVAAVDQPRLFRPFVQLDSSSSRRYGGAGLGLVISYDLVRLMGGNISIESEVGKGSMFSFTVSCARFHEPVKASRTDLTKTPFSGAIIVGQNAVEARFQPLVGKQITIVSDHAGIRNELERELGRAGAIPITASMDRLVSSKWDLAVVECSEATLGYLRQYWMVPEHWNPDKVIGLVDIGLENQMRQLLRPYFRTLLGKPLHHKTLINLLAKSSGDSGASADSATL